MRGLAIAFVFAASCASTVESAPASSATSEQGIAAEVEASVETFCVPLLREPNEFRVPSGIAGHDLRPMEALPRQQQRPAAGWDGSYAAVVGDHLVIVRYSLTDASGPTCLVLAEGPLAMRSGAEYAAALLALEGEWGLAWPLPDPYAPLFIKPLTDSSSEFAEMIVDFRDGRLSALLTRSSSVSN